LKDGVPATQVSIDHVQGRGATTVGRRRVEAEGPMSGAAKRLKKMPRWAWFAVPAGIAFLSAIVASLSGGGADEERPIPAPVATTVQKAPESKPAPVEAKAPVPVSPPAPVEEAAPHVAPKVAASPTPKPVRVGSPRPASRRQPSRNELKNPFR
jgi:hypothetical protein